MKNNEFRRPLLQSAALLVGVIVLATIAATTGSGSSGGGFLAIIAGIGNSILFVIGLVIGLGVCIAVLIAIFLAAVAMVSPEQASLMYLDLKKNFVQLVVTCRDSCHEKSCSEATIDLEECNRMKQEIIELQKSNSALSSKISALEGESLLFKGQIDDLQTDNSAFKAKIEELGQAVKNLRDSENTIRDLLTDLTAKMQTGTDPEMIAQIKNLERLQSQTGNDLQHLIERLNNLESGSKQLKKPLSRK